MLSCRSSSHDRGCKEGISSGKTHKLSGRQKNAVMHKVLRAQLLVVTTRTSQTWLAWHPSWRPFWKWLRRCGQYSQPQWWMAHRRTLLICASLWFSPLQAVSIDLWHFSTCCAWCPGFLALSKTMYMLKSIWQIDIRNNVLFELRLPYNTWHCTQTFLLFADTAFLSAVSFFFWVGLERSALQTWAICSLRPTECRQHEFAECELTSMISMWLN